MNKEMSNLLHDPGCNTAPKVAQTAFYIVNTIEECWDKDEDARLSAACVEDRMLSLAQWKCLDCSIRFVESTV